VIFSILIIGYLYLNENTKGEEFFSLGLLDRNGNTTDYFVDDGVKFGEEIVWNIYVNNHMYGEKDIEIRVKIINNYDLLPSSDLCKPSPINYLYKYNVAIDDDQYLYIPIKWSINNATTGNQIKYNMLINDNDYVLNLKSDDDVFGMLFELWVNDDLTNDYYFSWESQRKDRCVWNVIWFKIL